MDIIIKISVNLSINVNTNMILNLNIFIYESTLVREHVTAGLSPVAMVRYSAESVPFV